MKGNNQPIGIFDSGVGGLTVWKELVKSLPNESVIYYADSANCPYGPKNKETIISLASKVVEFLISKDCKIIIVACNTATAAAIDFLRFKYAISFIGMEPAVKPAAQNSKTKSIAVLATEGTFNGKLYTETSRKYAKDVVLNIKVGDKLVDIVEMGMINEFLPTGEVKLRPRLIKKIPGLQYGTEEGGWRHDYINDGSNKNYIDVENKEAWEIDFIGFWHWKQGVAYKFYNTDRIKGIDPETLQRMVYQEDINELQK